MAESRVCRGNSIFGECSNDDPSLKWGDDIVETLLTTDEAIQERGRVEIDKTFTNRKKCNLKLHGLDHIERNSMISIVDGINVNTGILRRFTLTVTRANNEISISRSVEVERNV